MKKLVTLILAATAALCLTSVAFADVIAGPMLVIWGISRLLPWLLVAAVMAITIALLRKFRKK